MNNTSRQDTNRSIQSLEGRLTEPALIYATACQVRNALQELNPLDISHDHGANPRPYVAEALNAADTVVEALASLSNKEKSC